MNSSIAYDNPHITNDDILHRRIPLDSISPWFYFNKAEDQWKLKEKDALQRDKDGISIFIDSIIDSLGFDATAVAETKDGDAVVFSTTAGKIRSGDKLGVIVDPNPDIPKIGDAHGLICEKPKVTKPQRDRILELFVLGHGNIPEEFKEWLTAD